VSTFVQTARDASLGDTSASLRASELVRAVQSEYPFDAGESGWLSVELEPDFTLPGRRDLLYLVLCTLVKNALMALRAERPSQPRVHVGLQRVTMVPGLSPQPAVRVIDNGPGIAPEVLQRLTREPVTTRAESGGSGMGLLFCQRVMTTLGGEIAVHSIQGQGTTVTLYFPPSPDDTPVEETR
jgi:two-component system response regulator PhcR